MKHNEIWVVLSYLFLKHTFITKTGRHRKLQTLEKRITTIVDGSLFVVFKEHHCLGRKRQFE